LGDCVINALGIGLSGLAAGGVEYVWENASLWKTINVINRFWTQTYNNNNICRP
jgi:hypothetical protein